MWSITIILPSSSANFDERPSRWRRLRRNAPHAAHCEQVRKYYQVQGIGSGPQSSATSHPERTVRLPKRDECGAVLPSQGARHVPRPHRA